HLPHGDRVQQRVGALRSSGVTFPIVEAVQRLTAPAPPTPRDYSQLPGAWCPQDRPSGRGTSSAGLRSKKPTGLSAKPMYVTGITGQSSVRTTWWAPKVYQTTSWALLRGASSSTYAGSPAPPGCWFG